MVQIRTRTGVLEGIKTQKDGQAYLGVPYAKAPIDKLRWKPPVRLDDTDEVIACKDFGYSAMQRFDPVMIASQRQQSEGCLTLNIWVKDPSKQNQPVMVYLHGGAYFGGGSSDPLYDGTNFTARNDVIIVTINYRLNLFGFMNFAGVPGGEDYKESGYLGILDQMAALEWVQENIAAFGGDPHRVTLFGESAGSGSAALLSIVPQANKLFHRIIAESGPIQLYNTPELTAPYAQEFLELMECKNMEELAAKPVEEIMEVFSNEFFERHLHEISLIFAPTCDGTFLPRQPLQAFKDGAAKDITYMIGSTENEFAYWSLYFEDMAKEMPLFWRQQSRFHFDEKLDNQHYEDLFTAAYPDDEPGQRYLEYTNQIGFRVGAELMAEYQSHYNNVYHYLFTYKSKLPGLGSCHAIELPFVMHNTDIPNLAKNLTGEVPPADLADKMNDTWFNFALSGKPSAEGTPDWPSYDEETRTTMVIGEKEWIARDNVNTENLEMLRPAFNSTLLSSSGTGK